MLKTFLAPKTAEPARTEEEWIEEEIVQAKQDIEEAEQHLFYADPDFILSARLKLQSARSKLNSLIRRRRGKHDDGDGVESIEDSDYLNAGWVGGSVDILHNS